MSEHIKCSNCKCKFINVNENIDIDFGYNRLGERYKCCVKCRDRTKQKRSDNREQILERKKQCYHNNKELCRQQTRASIQKQLTRQPADGERCCTRCYRHRPLAEFGEYENYIKIDDMWYNQTLQCKTCNVCRDRDRARREAVEQ